MLLVEAILVATIFPIPLRLELRELLLAEIALIKEIAIVLLMIILMVLLPLLVPFLVMLLWSVACWLVILGDHGVAAVYVEVVVAFDDI